MTIEYKKINILTYFRETLLFYRKRRYVCGYCHKRFYEDNTLVDRKPLEILPDRRKSTVKAYLQKHGRQVKVVVMDMSLSFKAAVDQALEIPIVIADRFHFCRYIYWALDRV